jgi:diadenosine tetraphosphate (Ap4A) HIT family hydrolase
MGMASENQWELHPQLAADTESIGDLVLCRVLASKDANYPWLILVPRRAGAVEITDLGEADRARLMIEIDRVARALKAHTRGDKLNIAALGNAVPQLHIHIIARRRDDAAWPRPIWGVVPARPYAQPDLERFIGAMQEAIGTR